MHGIYDLLVVTVLLYMIDDFFVNIINIHVVHIHSGSLFITIIGYIHTTVLAMPRHRPSACSTAAAAAAACSAHAHGLSMAGQSTTAR